MRRESFFLKKTFTYNKKMSIIVVIFSDIKGTQTNDLHLLDLNETVDV